MSTHKHIFIYKKYSFFHLTVSINIYDLLLHCKIHWYNRILSHNTISNGYPRISAYNKPCVNTGMLTAEETLWGYQNETRSFRC